MAHGDIENGASAARPEYEDEKLGEYGQLVRYISKYKGREEGEKLAAEEEEAANAGKKKKGKKSKGSDGAGFETPDDWLNTSMRQGLSASEVENRRRKTGWNELTTENESLFWKFIGFFKGPVLYGKSTSIRLYTNSTNLGNSYGTRCPPRRWSA